MVMNNFYLNYATILGKKEKSKTVYPRKTIHTPNACVNIIWILHTENTGSREYDVG